MLESARPRSFNGRIRTEAAARKTTLARSPCLRRRSAPTGACLEAACRTPLAGELGVRKTEWTAHSLPRLRRKRFEKSGSVSEMRKSAGEISNRSEDLVSLRGRDRNVFDLQRSKTDRLSFLGDFSSTILVVRVSGPADSVSAIHRGVMRGYGEGVRCRRRPD